MKDSSGLLTRAATKVAIRNYQIYRTALRRHGDGERSPESEVHAGFNVSNPWAIAGLESQIIEDSVRGHCEARSYFTYCLDKYRLRFWRW